MKPPALPGVISLQRNGNLKAEPPEAYDPWTVVTIRFIRANAPESGVQRTWEIHQTIIDRRQSGWRINDLPLLPPPGNRNHDQILQTFGVYGGLCSRLRRQRVYRGFVRFLSSQ